MYPHVDVDVDVDLESNKDNMNNHEHEHEYELEYDRECSHESDDESGRNRDREPTSTSTSESTSVNNEQKKNYWIGSSKFYMLICFIFVFVLVYIFGEIHIFSSSNSTFNEHQTIEYQHEHQHDNQWKHNNNQQQYKQRYDINMTCCHELPSSPPLSSPSSSSPSSSPILSRSKLSVESTFPYSYHYTDGDTIGMIISIQNNPNFKPIHETNTETSTSTSKSSRSHLNISTPNPMSPIVSSVPVPVPRIRYDLCTFRHVCIGQHTIYMIMSDMVMYEQYVELYKLCASKIQVSPSNLVPACRCFYYWYGGFFQPKLLPKQYIKHVKQAFNNKLNQTKIKQTNKKYSTQAPTQDNHTNSNLNSSVHMDDNLNYDYDSHDNPLDVPSIVIHPGNYLGIYKFTPHLMHHIGHFAQKLIFFQASLQYLMEHWNSSSSASTHHFFEYEPNCGMPIGFHMNSLPRNTSGHSIPLFHCKKGRHDGSYPFDLFEFQRIVGIIFDDMPPYTQHEQTIINITSIQIFRKLYQLTSMDKQQINFNNMNSNITSEHLHTNQSQHEFDRDHSHSHSHDPFHTITADQYAFPYVRFRLLNPFPFLNLTFNSTSVRDWEATATATQQSKSPASGPGPASKSFPSNLNSKFHSKLNWSVPVRRSLECFEQISWTPTFGTLSSNSIDLLPLRVSAYELVGLSCLLLPCNLCPLPRLRAVLLYRDGIDPRLILNYQHVQKLFADEFHLTLERVTINERNTSYEQIHLFATTTIMLVSHSSQVLNLLFSHPSSAIIEVTPQMYSVEFAGFARSMGIHYQYALGGTYVNPSSQPIRQSCTELLFQCNGNAQCMESLIHNSKSICSQMGKGHGNVHQNFYANISSIRQTVQIAINKIQTEYCNK
jgi:hypothetical protein